MSKIFKPAWWLPGPHLQTLWPTFFRRKHKLAIRHERLELVDGDFLDLAWFGEGSGPLVLILHGLNGSVESAYVNGMLLAIQQHGWRAVCMHFRGCSPTPNRLARSYHSGETGDLLTVLNLIAQRAPATKIFAVGYSLGGNVLLKALGSCILPGALVAAVAISIPFELAKTATHLSSGFSQIYQRHLVRGLVASYKRKFRRIVSPLNIHNFEQINTFWEFDDKVTAPLHGFEGAADYYQQSSSRQYLSQIKIPTLIIHAKNDPFTSLDSLPQEHEVAASVTLELLDSGGHVGFVAGYKPWRPVYWLEQRVLAYFSKQISFLSK